MAIGKFNVSPSNRDSHSLSPGYEAKLLGAEIKPVNLLVVALDPVPSETTLHTLTD